MEETRTEKLKEKTKIKLNKNNVFVYIFIISYLLIDEIIFSLGLGLGFTPYKFLFALAGGLFLFFLGTLPKNAKFGVLLQAVAMIVFDFIYITQYVYWLIFSTPYLVNSLSGAGEAMEFFSVAVNSFLGKWYISIWFIIHIIMFFTIYRIAFKKWEKPAKIKIYSLAAWIVSVVLCVGTPLLTKGMSSPSYLILYEHMPINAAKTFGMLPSMILDAKFNLLKISMEYDEEKDAVVQNVTIKEAETAQLPENTPSAAPKETAAPKPVVYEPNTLDIAFNMQESDETLLEMNEYFATKKPTMQNEYTGMFKGKNLILITAEGFSGAVINKDLTPTLYKLSKEGFVFNNFYTPLWYVSTSDGEYVATTGLLPKSGVWSYTKIANNYMPFAFGNQFAKQGMAPLAFHNHSYTYYNRDKSYPAMGYTYYAKNHGLEVTDQWPESDVEMMELSIPMYINEPNFHIYYLTVSGHMEYNFTGNKMAEKHKAAVENLNYSTPVKAYIACQIELDKALESLINSLESAGKLEDTVIALSADHYPYGLTNEEYAELMGVQDIDTTFQLYENDFLLWSSSMKEPVVVNKYCSSLDIAPTLSNLFALPYDSRLFMGKDIMSDESPIVVFYDKSFITDKVKYDAEKNQAELLTQEPVTEEYLSQINAEVAKMFKYSARIIENDYYNYLFNNSSE